MKFKNYIETESGIKDTSTSPGTAGQVLSSTVTGTSWIDPDTLEAAASKLVVIACKNVSGVPILKGTPVYQSGTVGATDVIEVEPADATISTGYLPAIGILQTTLNNNGIGNVVITGEFLNYSTADIPTDRPGGDPFTGDTVYLAAGGGLTCIKPTGAGNAIQNLGLIGKVSGGNAGSITVASIMRANDVPNLPTGRIWIGDGNTIVSDTVYVDDPNSSLIVNGTTLQTTEALSVIGAGYFSDKVSIGTASSTVPGDNSYTLNLLDLNSAIAFGDNSQTSRNVIVGEYGTTDTDQLWLHGKNGTFFTHNNPPSIAGVIDSIGNFGLGISSPNEKLDVAGVIRSVYQPAPAAGGTVIGKTLSYAISPYGIVYRGYANGLNSIQVEREANPSETFDLALQPTGGNVGVGTTAPRTKLHVSGLTGDDDPALGSSTAPLFVSNTANSYGLNIGVNNTGTSWLQAQSNTSATSYNMSLNPLGGSVGIGTTSPDSNLEVAGSTGSNTVLHVRNDSTGSTRLKLSNATDTNVNGFQIINNAFNGSVNLINYKATTLALWTNGSQRLTILSNGDVGIKTTSPIYELDVVGDIRARGNGTGNIYSGTFGARLSNYYSFLTTNSEFRVGYANGGGYSVCRASAFTVSSDYRLKEKIVTLTDPLDRLRQLNVYKFNWIDKPNEKAVDGFIAHEVAEVIPEAVVGVKDEIGIDGKPEYQGIDQAKIVPLLTAALQEAIKKIENLEERINLIENK